MGACHTHKLLSSTTARHASHRTSPGLVRSVRCHEQPGQGATTVPTAASDSRITVWQQLKRYHGAATDACNSSRCCCCLNNPQENPNAIPEGETPHNVTLLCYDPMTDSTKPGDRITVTGIYKARV